MNNLNVVGTVAFDNRLLNVYQSLLHFLDHPESRYDFLKES